MGIEGFRSLLSRSLALGGAEVPSLCALQIEANGSLKRLEEGAFESRAGSDGQAVLVAQLLGLLLTFIGPALTLRLLRDIWPKLDNLTI